MKESKKEMNKAKNMKKKQKSENEKGRKKEEKRKAERKKQKEPNDRHSVIWSIKPSHTTRNDQGGTLAERIWRT